MVSTTVRLHRMTNISGDVMEVCRRSVESSVISVTLLLWCHKLPVTSVLLCIMRDVICICSSSVPNQMQTAPLLHACFLKWSERTWAGVITDTKLFSQFMWKSVFFAPVRSSRADVFRKPCIKSGYVRKIKKRFEHSTTSFRFFFFFFELMKCSEQFYFPGSIWCGTQPLSLSAGSLWFVQHQIKCPYPKSGFQIASPPVFLCIFVLFMFWGWGVLCLYWVQ